MGGWVAWRIGQPRGQGSVVNLPMVWKVPKDRVVLFPFQMDELHGLNGGDPNHLLSGIPYPLAGFLKS